MMPPGAGQVSMEEAYAVKLAPTPENGPWKPKSSANLTALGCDSKPGRVRLPRAGSGDDTKAEPVAFSRDDTTRRDHPPTQQRPALDGTE